MLDTPKPGAKEAITALKSLGIQPIMFTGDNENTVYSINKPKADSLIVLKILDNMKEGEGRAKMMKKGRLIEELEEAGIIDKNVSIGAKHSKSKRTTQFNKYSRFRQSTGRSRVQRKAE